MTPLIDSFGRVIDYIRISVTDRCDLRCVYCMAEIMEFLPKKELLTLEELAFLSNVFVSRGVKKIRLTGGEPLVRKNVMSLIHDIGALRKQGLEELTLTTNATQLHRYIPQLIEHGIKRLNVSLDSLQGDTFKAITRWGNLDDILRNINMAADAGLTIKINVVVLKHGNDKEIHDMIAWAGAHHYDITFIEVMPMGDIGDDERLDQYWPLPMVRAHIEQRYNLQDIEYQTAGPARYCYCPEIDIKIGFITPLSHNFCESCNRVRLTCTGQLYMCLGQHDHVDLRHVLRQYPGDIQAVNDLLDEAMERKPKGHDFVYSRRQKLQNVNRHMNVTGG